MQEMNHGHGRTRRHFSIPSIARNRGYTLEMHGIMAAADPAWVEKYNAFIEATYTGERTLDRKTKELLQVAVEAALRADVDQIAAHIRVALRRGGYPHRDTGGPAMRRHAHGRPSLPARGLQAWAQETGFSAPESD